MGNGCRSCKRCIDLAAHRGASMNFGNLSHRFVSLILAVGIAGGILGLGAQAASAQGITATTPFSFSVDNQQYPPGKYQFTLASLWLLSIRDVDGGGEKF